MCWPQGLWCPELGFREGGRREEEEKERYSVRNDGFSKYIPHRQRCMLLCSYYCDPWQKEKIYMIIKFGATKNCKLHRKIRTVLKVGIVP